MNSIWQRGPVWPRALPFALFLILTSLQGQWGEASRYWIYGLKTLLGAWMVWSIRPVVQEMKWSVSWQAILAGVLMTFLWVGIDPWIPSLSELWHRLRGTAIPESGPAWNPLVQFRDQPVLAWSFIAIRILGSTFVVPPLEEVFFRSLIYRNVISPKFEDVPLTRWHWGAALIVAAIFGLEHQEWLAGIICGLVFQALVFRRGHLGDAITAHAITNFLLGVWIVSQGAWKFW